MIDTWQNPKKAKITCTGRELNPGRIELFGGNDPGYHYPTSALLYSVGFFEYLISNQDTTYVGLYSVSG